MKYRSSLPRCSGKTAFLKISLNSQKNGYDIITSSSGYFLQILHAINKVQLCCFILSIKTSSTLVSSLAGLVWPFGNFFWTCEILSAVFVSILPFIVVYWYPTLQFFLIIEVFVLIIVITKAIGCIWKLFRLVIFSYLYPSWSIFYPKLNPLTASVALM